MKITFEKIGRSVLGGDKQPTGPRAYSTPRDLYIPQSILLTPPPSDRGEAPIKFGKILENLFLIVATGLGIAVAGFLLLFVEVH